MARRDDDKDRQPWHNRTPAVLGASVIALVVVGLLILAAMAVAREFSETEQAPIDFVAPTYSATDAQSATTATTTQTITSTSPPQTTDIDGPSGSTTSGSSSSSTSSTTSSSPTSTEQTTARTEEEDPPTTRTSRQRPRTNVTRTLNPYP